MDLNQLEMNVFAIVNIYNIRKVARISLLYINKHVVQFVELVVRVCAVIGSSRTVLVIGSGQPVLFIGSR